MITEEGCCGDNGCIVPLGEIKMEGRGDKGLLRVGRDVPACNSRSDRYESDRLGVRKKKGYEEGENVFSVYFTSIFAREIIHN